LDSSGELSRALEISGELWRVLEKSGELWTLRVPRMVGVLHVCA